MSERIGDYEIGAELGSGGMGAVYRATHAASGAPVALKVLRIPQSQRAEAEARFAREVEIGRRVVHPNVVSTLDAGAGTRGGEPIRFLVMPLVEGETLRALLDRRGALAEGEVRHIAGELAAGLAALHGAGVVHRDVKPENVIVTAEDQVVLTDLGVALPRDEASQLSRTGQFVGSLAYAPPEAFAEEGTVASPAFDVWALGVLLYEIATGVHPFARPSLEATLRAVLQERPPDLEASGAAPMPFVEALIRRLLDPSIGTRPRDAQVVADMLGAGPDAAWCRAVAAEDRRLAPWARGLDLRTPLVGRDAELTTLRRDLAGGGARLRLLLGDPGSGRTRLVHEALAQTPGQEVTYVPCASARVRGWLLRTLEQGLPPETLQAAAAEAAGDPTLGARALAALQDPTSDTRRELGRGLLLGVGIAALARLCAAGPRVLWFDDVSEAPPDVRAEILEVARALPEIGGVLLVSVTRDQAGADIEAMRGLAHADVLDVGALRAPDVWTLLRQRFGADHIADDLAEAVYARAGGSPAVLLSFLDRLEQEGYVQRGADGHPTLSRTREEIAALAAPVTADGVWRNRILGLDPDDRELLDVASCVGLRFQPRLVGEVLGRPLLDTLRRLTRLERGLRLVRAEDTGFAFALPLIRRIVQAEMPDVLRTAYHRALAEALDAAAPGGAPLAPGDHLDRCEQWLAAGELARALGHARPAAGDLANRGGVEAAVALLDRFLASEADLDLEGIGNVAFDRTWQAVEAGIPQPQADLERWRARAVECGNRRAVACLTFALGHAHARSGAFVEAAALFTESAAAARAVGAQDVLGRAVLAHSQLCIYLGKHDLGFELIDEALALAEARNAPAVQFAPLLITKSAHWSSLDRFDLSLPIVEQALEKAREGNSPLVQCEPLRVLGAIYDRLARWEEAVAVTEEALTLSRRMRERINTATARANQAVFLMALGRLPEAYAQARAAVDLCADLHVVRAELFSAHALVRACAYLGRTAEAARVSASVRPRIEGSPDKVLQAQWRFGACEIQANESDWAACAADARNGLAQLGDDGQATWRARLAFQAGRAAWFDGDPASAATDLRRAWEIGRTMRTEVAWGVLAGCYLAHLDADVAEDAAAHRRACAGRMEVPYEIELAWIAPTGSGERDAAARVEHLLRPLEPAARERAVTGHWLLRAITEGRRPGPRSAS